MQRDLSGSVAGTAVVIALLFWLTHRRWLPMLWLLTLLALILAATLALGGLVLGTISVVSMGFAAVLLGLAVDYAVVHYQEALAHPQLSVPEIRRAIAPSILWAAITTISAFLVLNFGGLPGLAQLGTLVAIGVALAALVMVMIFLPPLFPGRRKAPPTQSPRGWWSYFIPPRETLAPLVAPAERPYRRAALVATGLLIFVAGALLCFHRPGLDQTANALRPQRGEAETALDEMTTEMGIPQDALWLIVSGRKEAEVYQRLTVAEAALSQARSNRLVGEYLLPTAYVAARGIPGGQPGDCGLVGEARPGAARGRPPRRFQHQCVVPDGRTGADLGAGRRQHRRGLAHQPGEPMADEALCGPHPGRMVGHGPGLSRHQ